MTRAAADLLGRELTDSAHLEQLQLAIAGTPTAAVRVRSIP